LKLLTDKKSYTKFNDTRNRASEALLINSRERMGDLLRLYMIIVRDAISGVYPLLSKEVDPQTLNHLHALDMQIEQRSIEIALKCVAEWKKLRKLSYLMTFAGEQQSINNTGLVAPNSRLASDTLLKQVHKPTTLGSVNGRVFIAMARIRRDVMDAVEMSRIMGDDASDAINRALSCFAKPERVVMPKVLPRAASYKEAGFGNRRNNEEELIDSSPLDFMTEEEWNELIEDYKTDFIPKWRDPRYALDKTYSDMEGGSGQIVYPWELENEVTEDFVQTVRDGEHAAAKEKGITDFVWIAVIDKKTDECCLKRSGLTTREIEDKLKSGELNREVCAATVPAAHFHCRCKLAPATDDLPDIPDDAGDKFESWMFPDG
jgi:hypothetical protein